MKKFNEHILFCPGPVNVADNVKTATHHEIGHREKEFSSLLDSINKKLLTLFSLTPQDGYYPVIITGSGTAANEAILSSVVGKRHILILSNGEFGERLVGISKIHNKHTHHLAFAWGELIDPLVVEKYIQTHPVDIIMMVHHETSTSMLNPVGKIGKIAKKHGIIFIVDAVSSAGIEEIPFKKWHIDFCSSSAGKAIGAFPGISFVIGKEKSFEALQSIPAKTMYLNLYNFYSYSKRFLQTPNTPAVQLFFALEQALANILHQGVAKRQRSIQKMNFKIREGLTKLGFQFFVDEKHMSSFLATVLIPPSLSMVEFQQKLRDNHIIIYNGKGPIKDKVFQVGGIGELKTKDVNLLMNTFKEVLQKIRKDSIQTRMSKKIVLPVASIKKTHENSLFIH